MTTLNPRNFSPGTTCSPGLANGDGTKIFAGFPSPQEPAGPPWTHPVVDPARIAPWGNPSPFAIPAQPPSRNPPPRGKLLSKVTAAIEAARGKTDTAKRTHMVFVLDVSSSMLQGKELTMAAFNDQLRLVRESAKEAGVTTVSLILFGSDVVVKTKFGDVHQVADLTHATYAPYGSTSLYDAIGKAIKLVIKADGFGEADTAFLVTVLTDGEENSSTEYEGAELAQCIQALEATKTVSFSILGPKEHLQQLGDVLKIERSNIGGYDAGSTQGRAKGMASMVTATSAYLATRAAGGTQAVGMYSASPDKLGV